MQVAGLECACCASRVQAAEDGTWCATCRSVLHRRCLEQRAGVCPSCRVAYTPPERRFAYSTFCPLCTRATGGAARSCSACGADTCWDTEEEYVRFRERYRRDGRRMFGLGLGAIVLGLALLALFLGLALPGALFPEGWPGLLLPVGWVGTPILVVALLCSIYGIDRVRRGASARGFR